MFSLNPARLALLLCVFAITGWYSFDAAHKWHSYSRLNSYTPALEISWEVCQRAEDAFALSTRYSFEVAEKRYRATTLLSEPLYRNRWAAEQALNAYTTRPWLVWYDKANPTHASLEKQFPTKALLSAAVLWAIFLYFLFLGWYVNRRYFV